MHGASWGAFMRHDDQSTPEIDRSLVRRVFGYAKPYKAHVAVVLLTIVVISGLTLLPPLLMRALIDTAIPEENLRFVTYLGIGMVAIVEPDRADEAADLMRSLGHETFRIGSVKKGSGNVVGPAR